MSSDNINITPLEPEDLELLYSIENDPSMWFVSDTTVPYSRYALREYIVNQQCDIYADRQVRMVIRDRMGQGVGLLDLFDFSPKHMRAEIGLAILTSHQGKGYAAAALEWVKDYAYRHLHLRQIYARIEKGNAICIDMFRRHGFSEAGILRHWTISPDGEANDVIFFQYIFQ